ncbi:MAG TPA: low temperature requirement protein A [Aquihabitans sp.]|jgi:low temperature requirement protein LtrA|nr:low temperature requirement protein A [Aquihabitans sp.]
MPPRPGFLARPHHLAPEERVHESVRPLELYFDLVFVLGFTQCTALMVARPTWDGIGHGVLVLAVLWWAWVGYSWLTSVIEPEEGVVRLALIAAMAGLLVVALCVPGAFDDDGRTFAIAYGVVRAVHIGLFVLASRGGPGLRRSVVTHAATTAAAVILLFGASFATDWGQEAVWVLAILVDWIGPAVLGIDGWRLVPAHFTERYNLVIILALGESIVALGAGAERELTAGVLVAAVLGVSVASALWWIYFDVVSLGNARRLRAATVGRTQNALARDSYSYLHFPMVAGIVLAALGMEETLAHHDEALDGPHAAALLGGIALYLLGHVDLRLRSAHSINPQRLALAVVLVALVPAATQVSALVTLAAVNVPLWVLIALETRRYGDSRYRLRHGLDIPLPGTADPATDGAARNGASTDEGAADQPADAPATDIDATIAPGDR